MSYLTGNEAGYAYSNWHELSTDKQTWYLTESYNLVLSYLNPSLKPPAPVAKDPEGNLRSPAILKWAQKRFLQHLVFEADSGTTEDLDELWTNTAEVLAQVTSQQIGVQTQTFPTDAGVHVIDFSGSGSCQMLVENLAAAGQQYSQTWVFEALAAGYTGDVSVQYRTLDEATYSATAQTSSEWQTIDDVISCRWTGGSMSAGDVWRVAYVPSADVDSQSQEPNYWVQKRVRY